MDTGYIINCSKLYYMNIIYGLNILYSTRLYFMTPRVHSHSIELFSV